MTEGSGGGERLLCTHESANHMRLVEHKREAHEEGERIENEKKKKKKDKKMSRHRFALTRRSEASTISMRSLFNVKEETNKLPVRCSE